MKEQKIIITISPDGALSADASGFTGDACLRDLEKLLDQLSPEPPHIQRKPESGPALIRPSQNQSLGKIS